MGERGRPGDPLRGKPDDILRELERGHEDPDGGKKPQHRAGDHDDRRAQRLAGTQGLSATEEAQSAAENVEGLRAALKAEEIKLQELKQLKPQLKVDLARKDLAVKEAFLEEAEHAVTECRRTAPFEGTVLRMLEKRPDDRFQTPAELLPDLERVAKYQGVSV